MSFILFLHGLGSKPGGAKVKYLEALGHNVINPALPNEDFNKSVEIADKLLKEHNIDVVIGSSRGGAVAMALNHSKPMVLVAPAWSNYNVIPNADQADMWKVIHSKNDDVIPIIDSRLLERLGCSLVVTGETHRMNDEEALKAIAAAI